MGGPSDSEVLLSGTTVLQPRASQEDSMKRSHVDLGDLMLRVHKLAILTRPIASLTNFLMELRRWEHSGTCILLLVMANASCLLVPAAYHLFLILVAIIVCGTLGFMHRRTQCLSKVFPNANIKSVDFLGTDGDVTHADIMQQYKKMLFTIDTTLELCNCRMQEFYSILKWENLEISIRSYTAVIVLAVLLHLLPLRLSVVMTINIFLLEQKLASVVMGSRVWVRFQKAESIDGSDCVSLNSQDSPSTDLDTMIFGQPDFSDSEGSEKPDDTSGPEEESDLEANCDTEVKANTSKSGVVGKLLEFKKKHQSSTGQCIGCNVQFSTILKRRHICSHCGNHFCARCCSNKVPRSMFGATSPAAQTETVPVCGFCYMYLTGRKEASYHDRHKDKEQDSDNGTATEKQQNDKDV